MNKSYKIIEKSGISEGRILYFKQLPSTQTWAVNNCDQLNTGDIIWTKNQTAGIGRLNKNWVTLPNTCLTFSIVLPSYTDNNLNVVLSQILAVTVGNLLESEEIVYSFKWPNDIMVNNRKISGIIADYIKKLWRGFL